MKPISLFIHAILAVALLAAAPSFAAPREADEAAVLHRLRAPEAAKVFKQYNAEHGQKIQHHLAEIYGTNPEYIADAGAGGQVRPLGDNIVGPVTLKWLAQFCSDYGIVAADPNFEQDLVASLEQVAGIARAHPDWIKILFSAEFEDWINGQPTPERVHSFKIRRSGAAAQVNALIEQYLREQRPVAPARPGAPLELTYAYDPKRPGPPGNLKLVGERLRPMARRQPEDEAAFTADVAEALEGVAIDDDTLPLVKRYSRTAIYVLRSDLLDVLGGEGMSEPAVEALRALVRTGQYDDAETFEQAIADAAEASPAKQEILRAKRRLVRDARVIRYRIPETLAADLAADAPLAPAVADLFAGIANVEYPTRELFDKAQEWQVQRALGMCSASRRDPGGVLGDEQLAALEGLLPGSAKLFNGIRELRAIRNCSVDQQLDAVERAYHVYVEASARLDRKMQLQILHQAAVKPRTAAWAKPGCQCGRGERDGMVVGFLPLWLETGGKQLDFGMLSRIGLYGLTADDQGALSGPAGFPDAAIPETIAALMRDAHRYNVKVDWVVGRSDWDAFSRASKVAKRAMLANLVKNIRKRLELPLHTRGEGLIRLASAWQDAGAVGGDGVALYFRRFPASDKALFKEFVVNLSNELDGMWPKRRLSLIVDQDELGAAGPYGYRELVDVIATANRIPAGGNSVQNRKLMVNDIPVLLMLNEPTQRSKKALRGGVQDALHGIDSMRLLRSLVPVVEYDGTSSQQLADDIVYASDNYYGIGFWALPFADPAGVAGVNALLSENFHPGDGHSEDWERYVGLLCPERLWVRGVFWGTLLWAIVVGGYYFSCRGCNERLDSSGVYFAGTLLFLALPVVALAVLAISDPLLEPYQPLLMFLFVAGGLVVAALLIRYFFNESRRKLP
jgi:hypothetical protein